MRVKKVKIFLVIAIVLAASFWGPKSSQAANLNMRQSILPVYFVYLDGNGEVEKIWNNVGKTDDVYVLKFFGRNNAEVSSSQDLFEKYAKQKTQLAYSSYKLDKRVDFVKTQNGIEEVETIV